MLAPTRRLAERIPTGDRGSAPVELAILAPTILLALFASIQTAAVFMARSVALSAAQEATTAQRAYDAPAGAGQQRATSYLARSGDWLNGPQVSVGQQGNEVTSTVTGSAISLIPGVRFGIRQTSRSKIERFTIAGTP